MAKRGLLQAKNIQMWGHYGNEKLNTMHGEKYFVDVKVWYDMEKQCETDEIPDGISYYDIDALIKEQFDAVHFTLLQPAAHQIANALVREFPKADYAVVTIRKKFVVFPCMLDYVAISVSSDNAPEKVNRLGIKNMRLWGRHGSPEEREIGEEYDIDVTVDYDMSGMIEKDSFDAGLSITDVYRATEKVICQEHYHLIQTITKHLVDEVEKLDDTITNVEVTVKKPNVQIQSMLDYLCVTLDNSKDE